METFKKSLIRSGRDAGESRRISYDEDGEIAACKYGEHWTVEELPGIVSIVRKSSSKAVSV